MRLCSVGLLLVALAGIALLGCSKESRKPVRQVVASSLGSAQRSQPTQVAAQVPPEPEAPTLPVTLPVATPIPVDSNAPAPLPLMPPEPTAQEKYDAALLDAVNLLTDHKYAEAMTALETVRTIQDTEQVRLEIEKVKKLLEQQAATDQTVQDIQTVLQEGKAEAAAGLATTALQQYGGSDAAEQLGKLKRQADALVAAQLSDNSARRDRFRQDGDAAMKEKNLRAAALAYEQAVAYGSDADLRRQLDDLHGTLTKYDESRQRAAELRRDPANLEDALAALQDAQKAWDTLQVRQDIDDCTLALQNRRERLAVADFEARGDTGIPEAGRIISEELLPAFKSRYDLIERSQLNKVVAELKLEASDLAENDGSRRDVGRLAKVRYLVLGSVTRLSGLSVNARLVDVRTGLVVQTAKIIAPSGDELLPLLPQLANVLMMSDEQKIAYERQQAQQAVQAVRPVEPAPLPPPPEIPVVEQPAPLPPAVIVNTARPPDLGGVRAEDFDRLPPPPPPGQVAVPVVLVERAAPVRQRLLQVSVELGDNLFRRGCFKEAIRHFELALSLAPERTELRVRIDRCQPHLPPPPPPVAIVIDEPVPPPLPPPPPPRPRLAILNFAELGDSDVIAPGLGGWTADNLSPYFCPPYEIVDRGEVFWYMGRLGLTMRDLMTDPNARFWLAQALQVRFFLLGTLRQGDAAGTIAATTHLLDAQSGCQLGAAKIYVRDAYELRLRLAELARLTLMSPEERLRYQRQCEANQDVLVQAQLSFDRGNFSISLGFFETLLRDRPDDVRVQVLFQRSKQCARRADLEAARKRDWERQQVALAEMQRRQWELARAAEAARLRAEQEGALLADADRRLRQQQCDLAHAQLLLQAQSAFREQNFQVSIQFYESALALKRTDDGYHELALARARAQEAARARTAEVQAQREAALSRLREAEVTQLRAQLDQERQIRITEGQMRRQAQQQRDQADYSRLLAEGQRLLIQEKYDRAIVSLQAARQMRRTDEVEHLVSQALVEQARATAQKKGGQERAALEQQLAAEKVRRETAEAEARRNQQLYTAALQVAQQSLAQQRYDDAITKYHEAEKFYRTDVVLTGLRQAEAARTADKVRVEADQRKRVEEQTRASEALLKMTEAQKALDSKQHEKAVQLYTDATKLAPSNIDALAGLSKAQQARADAATQVRRQKETVDRQAQFRTLVASGKANLAAKKFDAAVLTLNEAVKLNPADADAQAALQEAQKAQAKAPQDATAKAEAQKKAEAYQKRLSEGRVALAARQYDPAIQAFRDAQQLLPGDQTSTAFLQQAEKGKQDAAAAVAAETRKRADEQKRTAEVHKALAAGRTALAAHNLDGAARSFDAAARQAPQDPEVLRAQQDLQKAQETARAETEARQKRIDRYHAQMKQGRDAVAARRYDDAVKAFTEANRLLPDDRAAQDQLRQAEKAHADAHSTATTPPARPLPTGDNVKKREEEQRRLQVQQLLASGRNALATRQLDAAARAFGDASKLAPQDPAVVKALQDLERARSSLAADSARAKRQAAYQDAMNTGRAALAAKRYEDASKAYNEALMVQPGDPEATRGLRTATQALETAHTPPKPMPQTQPMPMPQPKPAQPQSQPRPQTSPQTQPLPMPQPKPPQPQPAPRAQPVSPPPGSQNPQAEYGKHMQAGAAAEKQQKYGEAMAAFKEALRLVPGDPKATGALRNAEVGQHVVEGQRLLTAKHFADAIKEYEAALKLAPGNADATAGLKRAREGRP